MNAMSAMYGSTESWRPHNARRVQIHIDTDLPVDHLTSRWSPSAIEPPEITVDPPSASRSSEDSLWIDRTSLATGVFDSDRDSCVFDALDEELLHHPVQCFADVCWAEAVSRADSRRASRIRERERQREEEQEEEDVRAQPMVRTDSRAVRWADDEAVEGALLPTTSLTQVRVIPRVVDEAPTLMPVLVPLPFSDKLNIVAPTERLAAEPAASSPPSFSAKPTAPDPYAYVRPVPSLNPITSRQGQDQQFVLNLNLDHGPPFAPADPSESIGFFPTPRRAASGSKTKPKTSAGSRFKLFAYFHTPRRV